MIRKSGKHSHATYGILYSCFDLIWSYQEVIIWSHLGSRVPGGDRVLLKDRLTLEQAGHIWLSGCAVSMTCLLDLLQCGMERWPSGRVSAVNAVVAGSISSGGDHAIHYRWHQIRSKQLYRVPYVACDCLPIFLAIIIKFSYIYIYIL